MNRLNEAKIGPSEPPEYWWKNIRSSGVLENGQRVPKINKLTRGNIDFIFTDLLHGQPPVIQVGDLLLKNSKFIYSMTNDFVGDMFDNPTHMDSLAYFSEPMEGNKFRSLHIYPIMLPSSTGREWHLNHHGKYGMLNKAGFKIVEVEDSNKMTTIASGFFNILSSEGSYKQLDIAENSNYAHHQSFRHRPEHNNKFNKVGGDGTYVPIPLINTLYYPTVRAFSKDLEGDDNITAKINAQYVIIQCALFVSEPLVDKKGNQQLTELWGSKPVSLWRNEIYTSRNYIQTSTVKRISSFMPRCNRSTGIRYEYLAVGYLGEDGEYKWNKEHKYHVGLYNTTSESDRLEGKPVTKFDGTGDADFTITRREKIPVQ